MGDKQTLLTEQEQREILQFIHARTSGEPIDRDKTAFFLLDMVDEIEQVQSRLARAEELINRILQPGMYWIELMGWEKAASQDGFSVEWWGEHGPSLELARARLIEAMREAEKVYPPDVR